MLGEDLLFVYNKLLEAIMLRFDITISKHGFICLLYFFSLFDVDEKYGLFVFL
jgi:hypothetical protein